MGFWSKMKGWLNFDGVPISILEVEQPITGMTGLIRGKLKISSKSGQRITQFTGSVLIWGICGAGVPLASCSRDGCTTNQDTTQFTYRFLVDETKGKGDEKKTTTIACRSEADSSEPWQRRGRL